MDNLVPSKVPGKDKMPGTKFDEIMNRFALAIGARLHRDVPVFLGHKADAYDAAKSRGTVPAKWFIEMTELSDVSLDWLLFGTGPMHRGSRAANVIKPDDGLNLEEYRLVPLLESRVTAGPEGAILYDEVADRLPFKRSWLERLVGRGEERQGALLLVRVRGESMSPTIDQGEIVLVDTHESERMDVHDGKIYLVVTPDGTVSVKRLVLKLDADGSLRLVCLSDNTGAYRPFSFTLEPGRSIKEYVLGRIRWAGKEFE